MPDKFELQKTPTDTLGRAIQDLRISVTDRCNFRCNYCMPAEVYGESYKFLPKTDLLNFDEITRITSLFKELGVKKVRITGGEPLVRNGVEKLIAMLSNTIGIQDLTLTTNGYLLAKKASQLKSSGLNRVTISLDSLDNEVFQQMNGRNVNTEPILSGIREAERVGLSPIKINCVVQKGINDHTIVDLAQHFKGTGHIVRFIEFMDVGNLNNWGMEKVVSRKEIFEMINSKFPLVPLSSNYRGEVASRYRYKDDSGEIGIITSVTDPFCDTCTRARLTTDGSLVTCLFASNGFDLRGPMRAGATDNELRDMIIKVWDKRTDQYSKERFKIRNSKTPIHKVEMYQIGG